VKLGRPAARYGGIFLTFIRPAWVGWILFNSAWQGLLCCEKYGFFVIDMQQRRHG
jgi:hypothetical protein